MDVTDYSYIENNLAKVRSRIDRACDAVGRDSKDVTIIAVTKNFPDAAIRELHRLGVSDFGENRVQEAYSKFNLLGDFRRNVRLHFLGHLQSNKVKDVLDIVDIIHSIDSLRLAHNISERALKRVPVFAEVNISGGQTRYGFTEDELDPAIEDMCKLPGIEILGLMAIAPVTSDRKMLTEVFSRMREMNRSHGFKELSMGMSDDFEIAVQQGATMVRVGRAILGERS